MVYQKYQQCIDACLQCAAMCRSRINSCLKENEIQKLRRCIKLDMECASICDVTASLLISGSDYFREACRLCAQICEACAGECNKHAEEHQMEHCRECAKYCLNCAEECLRVSQLTGNEKIVAQ